MRESKIVRSRERSQDAENRRQEIRKMKMMNEIKKINIKYKNNKDYCHCKAINIRELNIATIFSIRTRENENLFE